MDKILNEVLLECLKYTKLGHVASYIPELAKADPNEFGICVITADKQVGTAGHFDKRFTAQSVIKPLILLSALIDSGEKQVRDLVGVEATGKPFDTFNYTDQALNREHINPMVNTGAIALCTLIKGDTFCEKFDRLLNLARKIAAEPNLQVDEQVYLSEKSTGNKNRALAYMLKAYNMIDADVEDLLDCYFKACSVNVSSVDLARIGLAFACGGVDCFTGERLFDERFAKYINAVLITSGMYNGSGEFALNVGVPAKSGVGGGIMAVVPRRMSIGIYSPSLDHKGNSIAGVRALELLSQKLELSIF